MKKLKKLLSAVVITAMAVSVIAVSAFTGYAESTKDKPTVSAVNFSPVWGDKEANIASMTKLIEEAAEAGTDIIVFPEMALTGYSTGMEYLEGHSDPMPVELAESIDGPSAAYFSDLAEKYNMYIVYGATEPVEGDSKHAYNSAIICMPDGMVDSYRKITPVEGDWCAAGDTPKYFKTPWGLVGVSVCYDTYSTPEVDRLYSAAGCFMVLNPTAVVGGDWGWDYFDYSNAVYCEYTNDYYVKDWKDYYRLYLETNVHYDGLYIASANILGNDGPNDVRYFEGGSLIIGPSNTVQTVQTNDKYDYLTYYAGSPANNAYGLTTATIDPSLATNSQTKSAIFQPELYSKWYAELAEKGQFVSAPTANEAPVCAVVNMNPVWGDKETNCNMILEYMSEAYKSNVDIIVFPEMALTDYCSTNDVGSEKWNMVCKQAETTEGIYASEIQKKATEYGMYVVYGTPEVNPDDYNHPYNSAFVAVPGEKTLSYQKIQPVEGAWCTWGSEPLIVETPWGGMGISICKDTYSYPELERYYSLAGCKILVNPTASGGYAGKNFVYNTTLASIANRDNMLVLSADLVGPGGSPDDSTIFPGKSTIIGKNYVSPIFYTEESMTDEIMYVVKPDMSCIGSTVSSYANFNPSVFANSYAKLAAGKDLYDFSDIKAAADYNNGTTEGTTSSETVTTTITATEEATVTVESSSAVSIQNSTSVIGKTSTDDNAKTVDNASIKTGTAVSVIAIIILIAASGVMIAFYRKRNY